MPPKAKLYTSKAYLYRRIMIDKKELDEIAVENGVSMMTIFNWAKKFGIIKDVKGKR